MVGFDIRNISCNDYEEVEKLRKGLSYQTINSIAEDKNSVTIVAQLNDNIIGYINFKLLSNTSNKNNLIFFCFLQY